MAEDDSRDGAARSDGSDAEWHPQGRRSPGTLPKQLIARLPRETGRVLEWGGCDAGRESPSQPRFRPRLRLDATDYRLLDLLREDGRRPYADLARELQLSETAVRHRFRRLHLLGVFRATIVTDPIALGTVTAILHVRLSERPAQAVASDIAEMSETGVVALESGGSEICAVLTCDDNLHLTRTVDDVRAVHGVAAVDLRLFLQFAKNALGW